jgi:uncharacterized membrane protein YbaN (DUF454 family)
MFVVKNRVLRFFIFLIGFCSIVTGLIGIFVPLLPTTPFVLLGAWCFLKSSPCAHSWIYRQPVLGRALKNWEIRRAISRPTKRIALTMISLSGLLMWFKIDVLWVCWLASIFLVGVSVFIISANEN